MYVYTRAHRRARTHRHTHTQTHTHTFSPHELGLKLATASAGMYVCTHTHTHKHTQTFAPTFAPHELGFKLATASEKKNIESQLYSFTNKSIRLDFFFSPIGNYWRKKPGKSTRYTFFFQISTVFIGATKRKYTTQEFFLWLFFIRPHCPQPHVARSWGKNEILKIK
jgi:hypothetical protein